MKSTTKHNLTKDERYFIAHGKGEKILRDCIKGRISIKYWTFGDIQKIVV